MINNWLIGQSVDGGLDKISRLKISEVIHNQFVLLFCDH